jgi:hypothetical protein
MQLYCPHFSLPTNRITAMNKALREENDNRHRRFQTTERPTWNPGDEEPNPPRVDPMSPLNRACAPLATTVLWDDDGAWVPPPHGVRLSDELAYIAAKKPVQQAAAGTVPARFRREQAPDGLQNPPGSRPAGMGTRRTVCGHSQDSGPHRPAACSPGGILAPQNRREYKSGPLGISQFIHSSQYKNYKTPPRSTLRG